MLYDVLSSPFWCMVRPVITMTCFRLELRQSLSSIKVSSHCMVIHDPKSSLYMALKPWLSGKAHLTCMVRLKKHTLLKIHTEGLSIILISRRNNVLPLFNQFSSIHWTFFFQRISEKMRIKLSSYFFTARKACWDIMDTAGLHCQSGL